MPKKKTAVHNDLSILPEELRAPKFEPLRTLLLQCGNFGSKSDLPMKKIVEFFDEMKEKDRAVFEPFCLQWYRFLRKNAPDDDSEESPACYPKGRTAQDAYLSLKIAVVACCSEKEIKRILQESGCSFICEEVEPILRSRRPEWLSRFLLWIAQSSDLMDIAAYDYFLVYRRFLKEKLIKPIKSSFWIQLMFPAMLFETGNDIDSVPTSIYDQLKNDTGLIETEIWSLFEFESFPDNWNLTSWDTHFSTWRREERKGEDWKGTLCTLIEEGTISGKRVTDGCFRSLSRPYTDHEAKWFVRLLETMIERKIVTEKELVKDNRFLELLDNPNPGSRVLGLQILERLFKSNLVSDEKVLLHITGMFLEPAKGKVKKAISLLDKIAKKNEKLRAEIFRTALEGLKHEAVDIQQATLDLLLKYDALSDPEIMETINELASHLAVSVRRNIPELQKESKKQVHPLPPKISEPVKTSFEPIEPVKTFEELFDLAVRLVEKSNDIHELERFLDGLSRLGNRKPEDFETKSVALLARVQKKIRCIRDVLDIEKKKWDILWMTPFSGRRIDTDIHYLIASWITNSVPEIVKLEKPVEVFWRDEPRNERLHPYELKIGKRSWIFKEYDSPGNPILLLFSKRLEAVLESVLSGESRPLLSAPTHRNGWIGPMIFVRRFIESRKKKSEYGDHEKTLALLRLMPLDRKEALELLDESIKKRDDYCNAVRYVLGAKKVKIGQSAPYWIAAGRARNPFDDDPELEKVFPNLGPGAGTLARFSFVVESLKYHSDNSILVKTTPAIKEPLSNTEQTELSFLPSIALHYGTVRRWENMPEFFTWLNSIWPQNLDPATAMAINSCACDVEVPYDYGLSHILRLLGNAEFPLHSIGITAIFIGLSGKTPLVSTPALDCMISAIDQGRVKPEPAIPAVRELIRLNALKTSRWVAHLKTASEQSELHSDFVFELLEGVLDLLSARELGGFLEIMYEIGIASEKPIRNENARNFLHSFQGSGKAAKLAKNLLEIE